MANNHVHLLSSFLTAGDTGKKRMRMQLLPHINRIGIIYGNITRTH